MSRRNKLEMKAARRDEREARKINAALYLHRQELPPEDVAKARELLSNPKVKLTNPVRKGLQVFVRLTSLKTPTPWVVKAQRLAEGWKLTRLGHEAKRARERQRIYAGRARRVEAPDLKDKLVAASRRFGELADLFAEVLQTRMERASNGYAA